MTVYIMHRQGTGQTGVEEITNVMKHDAKRVLNTRIAQVHVGADDVVVRWGTTTIPTGNPKVVVNSGGGIAFASNKRLSRLQFQEAGVPVPLSWGIEQFVDKLKRGAIPIAPAQRLVLRPAVHAKGHYMRVGNAAEILVHAKKKAYAGGYVSNLIAKEKEYRVFVVSGKVVAVATKIPADPNAVAWNVAQGAVFDNVRFDGWPLKACEAAIKACKVAGLDFGAADVVVDAAGNPYLLEVNTAPAVDSEYRQAKLAAAFDYIADNGKDWIDTGAVNGWRDVVHPATWTKGRNKGAQARAA